MVAVPLMAFLSCVAVGPIAAQTLVHEEIDFTISAPFKLRRSDAELPAGKYILAQWTPDSFALYADNLTHPPVAMLSTIPRDDYVVKRPPGVTKILLNRTVLPQNQDPVLDGWTVPDGEGWEIVGVVANHRQIEAISRERHSTEQRGTE
jgi:hypothetical protein